MSNESIREATRLVDELFIAYVALGPVTAKEKHEITIKIAERLDHSWLEGHRVGSVEMMKRIDSERVSLMSQFNL